MFAELAMYTFVGLPIISIMLQVFAAVNSAIKNGVLFMLAFLQKYKIKGVNVKITMSFEVKTVNTETVIYNSINSLKVLLPAHFNTLYAKNSKKPTSSKKTDIAVTEINKVKIFKGFTEPELVILFQHSLMVSGVNAIAQIAPNTATMGYKGKLKFLILTSGFTITQTISATQVIAEIIIVSIISCILSLLYFIVNSF